MMEIYQNYIGENHKFDFEDSDNNNLIEGPGYYIIEDFINLEDLRKISNDLVSIEKKQMHTIKKKKIVLNMDKLDLHFFLQE